MESKTKIKKKENIIIACNFLKKVVNSLNDFGLKTTEPEIHDNAPGITPEYSRHGFNELIGKIKTGAYQSPEITVVVRSYNDYVIFLWIEDAQFRSEIRLFYEDNKYSGMLSNFKKEIARKVAGHPAVSYISGTDCVELNFMSLDAPKMAKHSPKEIGRTLYNICRYYKFLLNEVERECGKIKNEIESIEKKIEGKKKKLIGSLPDFQEFLSK